MYAIARATRTPIFRGSISEWNKNQIEFVQWCEFYYSITQDTERPDEKTLQDDFGLDSWLANRRMQLRKQQIQSKMSSAKSSSGGSAHEHEEFNF